jgi:hypothetical protein
MAATAQVEVDTAGAGAVDLAGADLVAAVAATAAAATAATAVVEGMGREQAAGSALGGIQARVVMDWVAD